MDKLTRRDFVAGSVASLVGPVFVLGKREPELPPLPPFPVQAFVDLFPETPKTRLEGRLEQAYMRWHKVNGELAQENRDNMLEPALVDAWPPIGKLYREARRAGNDQTFIKATEREIRQYAEEYGLPAPWVPFPFREVARKRAGLTITNRRPYESTGQPSVPETYIHDLWKDFGGWDPERYDRDWKIVSVGPTEVPLEATQAQRFAIQVADHVETCLSAVREQVVKDPGGIAGIYALGIEIVRVQFWTYLRAYCRYVTPA